NCGWRRKAVPTFQSHASRGQPPGRTGRCSAAELLLSIVKKLAGNCHPSKCTKAAPRTHFAPLTGKTSALHGPGGSFPHPTFRAGDDKLQKIWLSRARSGGSPG